MDKFLAAFVAMQIRFTNTDDERGATATECALLLALIALVIIGAVTLLGGNIKNLFNNAASSL